MSIYQAIISGIVQGVTEFFPISSSGHLAVLHHLFGFKEPQIAFDIFLHLGTIAAVVIYFWKDIVRVCTKDRRTLALIVLASIPTVIIALILEDVVERSFSSVAAVGWFWVITGLWIAGASLAAHIYRLHQSRKPLGALNSLMIGIAQGIAVLPGISRSGATIATGLMAGLAEEEAFKFSFLLSVPIILAASLKKYLAIRAGIFGSGSLYFILGGIAALAAGLATMHVLSRLIKSRKFFVFSIYCIVAGVLAIFFIR